MAVLLNICKYYQGVKLMIFSYYQTLRKPYSSFIEYLQILSGGKIDDVFY